MGEFFCLRLTTASAQCLHLSERFFIIIVQVIMLEGLTQQHDAIVHFLASSPLGSVPVENLEPRHWNAVVDVLSIIRPFVEIATEMARTPYPVSSLVIPMVSELRYVLCTSKGTAF